MSTKARKGMGLPLFILSFFFLFNPDLSLIDPIPDIIGYVIMYFALSCLSDVNYHFEEARTKFKYGIYAGICELVALAILFGLVSEAERSISILLFTFVFGVADIIILLPAYRELFEGFVNLGTLCDGEAMFSDKMGRANYTERVSLTTVIFVIVKSALTCLPELTSLINNSEYRFIGLLRFFAVIIMLAVGIVWLVCIVKYVYRIYKDEKFIDNVTQKYNAFVIERPLLFKKRRLLFGIGVICIGLALSVDIYGDYFNFLPDFICAAVVIFGLWTLREFSPKWKPAAAISALYGIISTVSWVLSLKFFNEYYPEAALKNADAYDKYSLMLSADVIDAVCFVILAVALVVFLCDVAKTHAAPKDKDTLTKGDLYHEELMRGIKIFIALAVLSSIMTLYYVYFITSSSNAWYVEMAVIFTAASDIAFAAYTYFFTGALKKEISSRYALA